MSDAVVAARGQDHRGSDVGDHLIMATMHREEAVHGQDDLRDVRSLLGSGCSNR